MADEAAPTITPTISERELDSLLRRFRRHTAVLRVLRVGLIAGMAVLFISVMLPGQPPAAFLTLLSVLAIYVIITIRGARTLQRLEALAGEVDGEAGPAAARELIAIAGRFTLSMRAKLMAGYHLAGALRGPQDLPKRAMVCRELLRLPWPAALAEALLRTRLQLVEMLLVEGRVTESYEHLRPACDQARSLSDRAMILSLQLRYELATENEASAVTGLTDKVRVAETLDPPRAGLTHALLAEACRRRGLAEEAAFLTRRAKLYVDLNPLAEMFPVIKPIAE